MDSNNLQNGFQNGDQLEKPMSLGEWLLTIFISGLPCVGIVMLFVWAFGQGNVSRKNYCRAVLIFAAIGLVLGIIFYAAFAALFINALNSMQ